MQYRDVKRARFLERPNRFIAYVDLEGRRQICHVKNTGRCRELLLPGAEVFLETAENPNRKTPYDLIAVRKGDRLINMDAQAPNHVFGEWAADHWPGVREIRPEYTYGHSRFDFRIDTEQGSEFVEVKGVTLEEDGFARFPDAPTERGVKHIEELQRAAEAGFGAMLFFVVQMEGIHSVAPNDDTHPAFGAALRQASRNGVRVLAYDCLVSPDRLELHSRVKVIL